MKFQIKHRFTGAIIFEHEAGSRRDAVVAARNSGADLSVANLSGADLSVADLSEANLSEANLSRANLYGADLSKTVLDPANKPNADAAGFELIPNEEGWVYGYRTRTTCAAGKLLQDDRIYGTEVFSTCDTECHPGWYLWPTLERSKVFREPEGDHIRVKARVIDIHHAGSKWRSRAIWTLGSVK